MLVLLVVPATRVIVGAEGVTPTLDREFNTQPREAKPYTWWTWLATVNPPANITRDLEEFHAEGLVDANIKVYSKGQVCNPEQKVVMKGKEYRKVKTDEYGGKSAERHSGHAEFWSDENLVGIRQAAKEANYQMTFELPESLAQQSRLFLELCDLAEIAEVMLNGKRLGLDWLPHYQIEISSAILAGTNQLEIRVANLWANRLNWDSLRP